MSDDTQAPIVIENPFSESALKVEVDNLEKTLPANEAKVGLAVQNGDIGVEGTISKAISTHGDVAADASWFKKAGWNILAAIGWKW
jgi:hypothetical protein